MVKGKAKWRLLTIPHFVYNDFISSYRSFMPKLRSCCNTNWFHSNRAENQVSINAFRGTVALKVALDHFLLKGGHQHRARGRISLKSGKILSVIFHFYRRFSFLLSNQSHSPRRKRHWAGLFFTVFFFLSCVSPIKTKMGGRINIFPGMKPLKTSYMLLKREEPKGLLHLFVRDRLPVLSDLFC